jgi:hypothetical protein
MLASAPRHDGIPISMGQPPSASLTSAAATKNATESHRQLQNIVPDCTNVFRRCNNFLRHISKKQKNSRI